MRRERVKAIALGFGAASVMLLLAIWQIYGTGRYGYTLFFGVPAGLFLLTRSGANRLQLGRSNVIASYLGGLLFLPLGMMAFIGEGGICILMALPLVAIVFGGIYLLCKFFSGDHRNDDRLSVIFILAALIGSLLEARSTPHPQTHMVSTSVIIGAPPETVWHAIVNLGKMPEPKPFIFKVGVACPEETQIVGKGVGASRNCMLSTGPLRERIDEWNEGRVLGWTALNTPAPLREINPFRSVDPPHLHNYYRIIYGQFVIEPLPGGKSRLTRNTWYQHGLKPEWYWRLWSDYVADVGHRYVLEAVKSAAEKTTTAMGRNRRRPLPN